MSDCEALTEAIRRILAHADAEGYGIIPEDPRPYLRAIRIIQDLRQEVDHRDTAQST